MKLRNKKTGEIIDLEQWRLEYYKSSGCITITNDKNQNEQFCYGAFADMKDEWEDVEPLIKDEKIRKAVRAWAEANGLNAQPIYFSAEYNRFCDAPDFSIAIDFYREVKGGPHDGYSYYLGELCGEDTDET